MSRLLQTTSSGPRSAHGFTMVETLVALVVLGVGMLGIAGLYVVSLRSSGSAISRMQAVNLASDIADRIRANRTARGAYEGDGADHKCNDGTTICTPAQMAAHDVFLWEQQIEDTLPGEATGTIVVDDTTTPRTYEITVEWAEPGEAEDLQYVLRMQI